jgi:hypothetical protein
VLEGLDGDDALPRVVVESGHDQLQTLPSRTAPAPNLSGCSIITAIISIFIGHDAPHDTTRHKKTKKPDQQKEVKEG